LVANIHGKPIFVVTEVALTPLTSRKEAETAVEHTQAGLQKRAANKEAFDESDTDDEEGEGSAAASDDVEDEDITPLGLGSTSIDNAVKDTGHNRRSSIAEDVITRKGGYGRFAQKWFSGKGWTANQRRTLGMSTAEAETVNNASANGLVFASTQESKSSNTMVSGVEKEDIPVVKRRDVATLLPKLLRTTRLLFGSSRSFYFSYDYDVTRSFANSGKYHASEIPLHKVVDPLFFWNQNVIQPFIDAGQYSYVLPLMQGFISQRSFTVDKHPTFPECVGNGSSTVLEMKEMTPEGDRRSPEPSFPSDGNNKADGSSDQTVYQNVNSEMGNVKHLISQSTSRDETQSFLLTLISRRSVKRAGLRYLRRGVDSEGNTANGVETEQVLSSTDWPSSSKIYSFLQIRGSIPLFFSQSPYSFKPVPQLQQSAETNFLAFEKHLSNLSARYGSLQMASLVERHGVEAHIGEEYENNINNLNESGGIDGAKVGFQWFDFHAICRGMKFENVSFLMENLGPTLDAFGTTIVQDNKLVERQSGILRTNCMDCLDRTNVVQSACGRRALELQLKEEGFDLSSQLDQTTEWFNTLWADNGDAISKQYASTAALKGDFTRTRKRNYRGALTDMGLSISRFYSGQVTPLVLFNPVLVLLTAYSIVNDYFSQAAIDFLLGNVTSLVFEEFESNMMSADPAVSMRKVRQQAIDVSQRLVVADQNEELIGGWALLTPHMPNTIKSIPFEESVLLLTDVALYACRLDLNMEKVLSFERVDLRHIVKIQYGTYIISTLSAGQADEIRNVGFVVTYKAGENDITRINTRSMSTAPSRETSDLLQGESVAPLPLPGFLSGKPTNNARILAFKALPARSAVAEKQDVPTMSEIEQVKHICEEIERMALAEQAQEPGFEKRDIIKSADIISLAEARKSTGLLEQLGHSLKKLVWA
jgi:hypothetical protein